MNVYLDGLAPSLSVTGRMALISDVMVHSRDVSKNSLINECTSD